MPKAPKGYHKCADGKTIRPLRPSKGPINYRAKMIGSQRVSAQRRRDKIRAADARRQEKYDWEGTGSRNYRKLPWWSKLIRRVKVFFSERERTRRKHKALYKKAGRIKAEKRQFDERSVQRGQHR